jgi:methionine-R-sulfoxide reductase
MNISLSSKILNRVVVAGAIIVVIYFFIQNSMDLKKQSDNAKVNQEASDEELTPEQRHIVFEKGTEDPFSSELLNEKRAGTYYAVDTKEPVFRSEDKFDSGTGWPSFTKPISPDAVSEHTDQSHGMTRVEVTSSEGGHLGHVFPDGPQDKTGLRYCINGDALYFVPDEPTGE